MANVEALEQVIRVLENVADSAKPFIMNAWVETIYGKREIHEKGWFGRDRVRFERYPCGTAGCAIGYAASDPWFTSRGLHLVHCKIRNTQIPSYRRQYLWAALKDFFDLSLEDAMLFFYHKSYIGTPTPLEVANRIRSWLDAQARQKPSSVRESSVISTLERMV